MSRALVIISLFFFAALSVSAQSDTSDLIINVDITGTADTTPPTTPSIIVATPVAATQIDVSWTPSADDTLLGGYQVFRDAVAIATTTATSFSDTSLSASTTYVYAVRAFDYVLNYSTTSTAVATTTLQAPVVATSTPTTSSGGVRLVSPGGVTVTPGSVSATIEVSARRPVQIVVRWGETPSYELGASAGDTYQSDHLRQVTNLQPNTQYYYELVAVDSGGIARVIDESSFVTLGQVSAPMPPANVERFSAIATGDDVLLSWQLPAAVPGGYVRVVRSSFYFPAFVTDGVVVYEGAGSEVTDQQALAVDTVQYYTAFVYDADGTVSSGAVAAAYRSERPTGATYTAQPIKPVTALPPISVTEAATSTIEQPAIDESVLLPELDQIFLSQTDRLTSFSQLDIVLTADTPVRVSIPAESITGNLKSIIATIINPTDHRQQFSFLLRLSEDEAAYEAVIAPVLVQGASMISVRVYDFESAIVASYRTPVTFVADEMALEEQAVATQPRQQSNSLSHVSVAQIAAGAGIAALFWLLILLWRRRREDK